MKTNHDQDKLSYIEIQGASEHNLKNIDLKIPKGSLVVFSGVSGSGKSSLAFETLYKEGQRRYLGAIGTSGGEEQIAKPLVESVTGLSATVAIEQKSVQRQPRSLVGTLTQCYDLMRVLWSHEATPFCPDTGKSLSPQSNEEITKKILAKVGSYKDVIDKDGSTVLYICSRLAEHKKGTFTDLKEQWLRSGFLRAFIDDQLEKLDDPDWNLDPKKTHTFDLVIDRFKISASQEIEIGRIRESVERALELGGGRIHSRIGVECWSDASFGYSVKSGLSYAPLTPSDFSFNSPKGMCSKCQGLGVARDFLMDKVIDPTLSIAEGALTIISLPLPKRLQTILHSIGLEHDFSLKTPWFNIPSKAQEIILHGFNPPWVTLKLVNPRTGRSFTDRILWKGILGEAWTRYQNYTSAHAKKKMEPYLASGICPQCRGSRLAPYPSHAKFFGKKIWEFSAMSAKQAFDWLSNQTITKEMERRVGPLIHQLLERLSWMNELGLDYLALDRPASTLSGGEAQRVRLCAHLGTGLTGVIYILDEPSIGLHARDNQKLILALKKLRDRGNSVIVVEHDEETLLHADYVVDFGPGAGETGGEIIFSGTIQEFLTDKKAAQTSLTAQYVIKKEPLQSLRARHTADSQGQLHLNHVTCHNLNDLSLSIPLKKLVGLTGVSGSGKSTLMHKGIAQTLEAQSQSSKPHFATSACSDIQIDQVIAIDQTPIGRLPRSNPATYVKLFDDIRSLFAQIPLSKERGYSVGRFSFNVSEGSCALCQGMGYQKIDMDFMADEYVVCKRCAGKQFDESTLDVTYRGLNIHQTLTLSISKALTHFSEIPSISKKLKVLEAIGLGYLPLGHPSPYLSGGEAQRIKLAKELMRSPKGHILYLLDEPTTGLHMHDVQKLVNILNALVDLGHSVVVIEHHLDFLTCCDHLIEMGPEGGALGGKCIANCSSDALAKKKTPTGSALAELLRWRKKSLWSTFSTPSDDIKSSRIEEARCIEIKGAAQNNLRSLDLNFAHRKMHLVTGLSGSGKSSLLQQTLYSYGIRQYSETLTPYARQFLSLPPEPIVETISGLGPSVLVHGEHHSHNPRSTLGTVTECYDFLRLLFARAAQSFSPKTGRGVIRVDSHWLYQKLEDLPKKTRLQILSPVAIKGSLEETLERYLRKGFVRACLDKKRYEISELLAKDLSTYNRKKSLLHIVIDRIQTGSTAQERILSSLTLAQEIGNDVVCFDAGEEKIETYHCGHCDPIDGSSLPPLTPQDFAFNHPKGMCSTCSGWGSHTLPFSTVSFRQSNYSIAQYLAKNLDSPLRAQEVISFCNSRKIPLDQPICTLKATDIETLLWGEIQTITLVPDQNIVLLKTPKHAKNLFLGLGLSLDLPKGEESIPCRSCCGSRLSLRARCSFLIDASIETLCCQPVEQTLAWLETNTAIILSQPTTQHVLAEPLRQIKERLGYLMKVGLNYLPLHASAPSMSLGERSRARLAKQLGARLCDLCYILDEVSCGLHPLDSIALARSLTEFKEQGNTLIIADHNRHWAGACDTVTELGPSSGANGGDLCFSGTLKEYTASSSSLAQSLFHQKWDQLLKPPAPNTPPPPKITLQRASANTLKEISCSIPLGKTTIICGRSGSGKSSLLHKALAQSARTYLQSVKKKSTVTEAQNALHTFHHCQVAGLEAISSVEVVDSNPIGRSARADVGSYLDLLSECRQVYAQLPQAKEKGLSSKYFSPNTRSGMCKLCRGLGYQTLDLKYMPPTVTQCSSCSGMRLSHRSLEVQWKGRHFGHLLHLSLLEAKELLGLHPKIKRICDAAIDLGLGYLKVGEEIKRLSIGEAQRLKLATSLKKRHRDKILFLLDEPSKGLHPKDMPVLLRTFEQLNELGHTVVAVEHSPEIILHCDHLVELGPGSGPDGGEVVYEGAPSALLSTAKKTPTFQAISSLLTNKL